MAPLRRSTRRRRVKKVSDSEFERRCSIREKKRRETLTHDPIRSSSSFRMLQELPSMISGISSDDGDLQLDATTRLLKLLSVEYDPPIDEVVQSGAVPRLLEFLQMDDGSPELQHEAARVLKNITAGTSENTKTVVEHGALPVFVKLLESSSDQIREQAACALGNIAGDSPTFRDLVLSCGALRPLLAQLNEHSKVSLLRTGTWTLSNLCEGTPQPPFEQFVNAIPVLESLIFTNDEAVLAEACWALSYLCRGCGLQKPDMLKSVILPKIAELLRHPSPSVVFPATQTLGSIFCGDDSLIEHAFRCKAEVELLPLFGGNKYRTCIGEEASWAFAVFRARFVHIFRAKERAARGLT